MIHYIIGNIFDSKADALVNTVNTVGVMGKGIALQFKEAFPENYRIYRQICKEKKLNIGELLVTEEANEIYGRKTIINFPTKRHWRYPSEYSFISQGLVALRKEIWERKIKSIAIPALGSHNGGLEWQRVKAMMEESLADLDCDIHIYEPSPKISEKMKSERIRLTPARAMLIIMLADICRFGEFASVFAAEKLIYFMQRLGAKDIFKIDFKPYIYGPYSGGKVAHVLYHLNGSYIKGMTALEARPFDFIWLTDDAEKEALAYLQGFNDNRFLEICDKTKALLRTFYSNYSLELLSTVDFILHRLSPASAWKQEDRNTLESTVSTEMQKWSTRKGQIFKSEFIRKAIDHLRVSDIP
ncbi:MAG: macro domain-containing protein [Muribaculaceae bacterium]|nr:macro domain-containing protein [Muribaculaceae bacterium]MDE6553283.1 macro domain-containing protein [Muribaculaceae bacterium]